jgi:hypothetical protein
VYVWRGETKGKKKEKKNRRDIFLRELPIAKNHQGDRNTKKKKCHSVVEGIVVAYKRGGAAPM